MADLLRQVTVRAGLETGVRTCVCSAYGGAGPTHAYAFAHKDGESSTSVVPYTATVHSAYGAV